MTIKNWTSISNQYKLIFPPQITCNTLFSGDIFLRLNWLFRFLKTNIGLNLLFTLVWKEGIKFIVLFTFLCIIFWNRAVNIFECFSSVNVKIWSKIFMIVWVDGETSSTSARIRQIATGFCPWGDPRSSTDSNSIKVPFICRGGPSNRLGRERRQRKLQGLLNSSEVPPLPSPAWIHHLCPLPTSPPPPLPLLLLPQFTHVPASNKCSKKPPPIHLLLLVTQAKEEE